MIYLIMLFLSLSLYAETTTPDRITKDRQNWGLDFKLNSGLAKGNTDYFTFHNSLLYFKNFSPLFFYTTGDIQYGENKGQKNSNTAMVTTRFDYHLSGGFSAIFLNTTGYNEFTRVRFKAVTGIGPLYEYKLSNFKNGLSAVLAYNYETYNSSSDPKKEAVIALRDEIAFRITEALLFYIDYFYIPALRDFSDFNMRLTTTLESIVWKDCFSTLITVKAVHDSMPQPGVKRNDLQLLAGIALKLGK